MSIISRKNPVGTSFFGIGGGGRGLKGLTVTHPVFPRHMHT